MTALALLSLLGPIALTFLLLALGFISRKLGRVTHAAPAYIGFWAAGLLSALATWVQLYSLQLAQTSELYDNAQWMVIYNALLATAVTVGLLVAWRYWSWLIADRD